MMTISENYNYKIALLIDAENISNKYADGIMNSLTRYGRVIVKNAYVSVDDKGAVTPNAWINTCKNKGMHLVTQTRNASGKNCVDSKLIIDAMDILHLNNDVDCFCLVSSDSDFTTLASRLRETGKYLIGMGEKKTIVTLRKACDEFIELERVVPDESLDKYRRAVAEGEDVPPVSKEFIASAVRRMVADNMANDRVTNLSEIGSRLKKMYPDFDSRNYGFSQLGKFLASLDGLSVVNSEVELIARKKKTK